MKLTTRSGWILAILLLLAAVVLPVVTGSSRVAAIEATPTAADPCQTAPATPEAVMTDDSDMSGMNMEVDFDLAFIDGMISHHANAIAMAQIGLTRAEHDEIKKLAENIIASQSAEIEQLTEWRQAWYPNAAVMTQDQIDQVFRSDDASMASQGMDMGKDAIDLCSVTEMFDIAFIDAMTPHHESAVMMSKKALEQATRPEIKELATQIIAAQEQEIAEMTTWRAEWSQ